MVELLRLRSFASLRMPGGGGGLFRRSSTLGGAVDSWQRNAFATEAILGELAQVRKVGVCIDVSHAESSATPAADL